jgi:hypothetical protein
MIPGFAQVVKEAVIDRAEELFRLAWGEPQRPAARQWRARDGSARAMWMQGPKRGKWHDFKSGAGGDVLELVAVEFCGLSSAKDDFPRVLDEAARLCGIAKDEAPSLAQLEARKAERKRVADAAQEAEDAQRAATVAGLQARAQDAAQSPAAAYLRGRGIDALPAGPLAYLPPVPGMAVLHPHRPALVVWAQDDFGRVMGGQRILICEDGSKAPEDPRKPSFGKISGFPARFPARVENSPLCIAEGPETALAIWQATGFEVWAVLSVNFFETAPAPLDRQVILCPDCDAPDSPAAKAFDRACMELAARGCEVWIARAPEPEGSKRDLADTLQGQGPEAVKEAVKAAKPFTPRAASGRFTGAGAVDCDPMAMPDFLEVAEARERIRQAIQGFLGGVEKGQKAKSAWVQYCNAQDRFEAGKRQTEPVKPSQDDLGGMDDLPPDMAIAASPGMGKSRIAREELARLDLSMLAGDVVFYTPTLALAEEAAAHARELQAGSHVTRGRSAINPATGLPMCARFEEAERAAKAGLTVKPTLCERETENGLQLCPHHASCAYLQQWAGLGPEPVLRFEASQYLALDGDGSGRKAGLRVIDESVWRLFTRKADLPLDRWQQERAPGSALPRNGRKKPLTEAERDKAAGKAADATQAARDALRALQDGKGLLALGYTAEDFQEFAKLERGPDVLDVAPSASDEAIRAALKAHESRDRYDSTRAAVWAVLADCVERGIDTSERLQIVANVPAPGSGEPRDVLRVCWFADPPRDAPALLLDADADAEIAERLFPGAQIVRAEVRPRAHVVQVSDRRFSNKTLSKLKTRQELAELVKAEVLADSLQGARGVLVIATKAAVRAFFEDAGHKFEGMNDRQVSDYMQAAPLHGARWLWFGPAALGRNTWQGFGTAVVIGREELPLATLQDYLRALKGDTGEPLDLVPEEPGANYPEILQPYLMADGSGRAVMVRAHPDKLGRALQMQGRELATRQSYERLRLATAEELKRVVIACNVPVPGLPVDDLVSWAEMAPSRFEAAMAEAAQRGGVLRFSAAGLAQDAPETFPTEKAAEGWLSREGKGALNTPAPLIRYSISGVRVLNPVQVQLRLQGQRGRFTPALVVLPGDPRAMAEAQLGPLAGFDLVNGGNLTKPDIAPYAARPDFLDVTTREATPPKMSENSLMRDFGTDTRAREAPAEVQDADAALPPTPEAVILDRAREDLGFIKEPRAGELVSSDDFAWRRADRIALKAAEKRPQIAQMARLVPGSDFGKVAAAIHAGHKSRGAVSSASGIGVTRVYQAVDAMKAAGLVKEGRTGRLYLQIDAQPLEVQDSPPAPVVMASGAVLMPQPQRKLIVLPENEQVNSDIVRDFLQKRAQAAAARKAHGLEVKTLIAGFMAAYLDENNPDLWS